MKGEFKALLLLLGVLVGGVLMASEKANFPVITEIKTGEHKLTLSTIDHSSGPRTYFQPFFVDYTAPPNIAIGILVFQAETSIGEIGFTVEPTNITTTGFTSILNIQNGTVVNQLRYMYLSISQNSDNAVYGSTFLMSYTDLSSTFSGVTGTTLQFSQDLGVSFQLANINHVIPVLNAYTFGIANDDLSVRVETEIESNSSVKNIISSNSSLSSVSFYVIWVDQTQLEANYQYFFDAGYTYGENNQVVDTALDIPPNSFNYYNYIQGAAWMAFSGSNALFSISFDEGTVSSISSFKFGLSNSVHWLRRQCLTYTYYLHSQAKCYDTCPTGYAENSLHNFCQECHYSCKQCLVDGISCTECSNTSLVYRELDNASCPCVGGYFDDGLNNEICAQCHYSCTTCEGSSERCLSCDETRELQEENKTCLCLEGFYDTDINDPVCAMCDYSCLTCSGNFSICTSCNASANRILTSLDECLCKTGFSETEAGVEHCTENPALVCASPCFTCNNTATACTSCPENSNRELSNSRCSCIRGYESVSNSVTCTEVCGDGVVYEDQCDDGNKASGDGCSSSCEIQDGYTCDNTTQPTLCTFDGGYDISLKSIKKSPIANEIIITFQVLPAPPATSIPTVTITSSRRVLEGDQDVASRASFSQVSYSISGSRVTVTVEYSADISERSLVRLRMSDVGSSSSYPVVEDSGLAINYYSVSEYSVYEIEIVLIWVLIGCTWAASIIFLVLDRYNLLMVIELMMGIGMAWLGSAGFTRYLIYFYPLLNLKYIFGYNIDIDGEDGMLSINNYGLLIFALPVLIFLICMLLGKCKYEYAPSQQTKLYLLMELSYAWLCINSILLIYGMFTETFTKTFQTSISIASMVVGLLYLAILMAASILMIVKEDSFSCLKFDMNLEKKKGPVYFVVSSIWAQLISALAYLFTSYYYQGINYSPLIISAVALIAVCLLLFLKPYKNSMRLLFNHIILFLVFLCYFMIREVEAAEWSGFAILVLLYLQVLINSVMMARSTIRNHDKRKFEEDEEDEDEEQVEEEELEEYGKSNNGDVDQGDYEDYEGKIDYDYNPTKKKEMHIDVERIERTQVPFTKMTKMTKQPMLADD